ncbi:Protein OPAQUE1 [Camellia lanceoleosa]|uniref:Protein OPAQUE1 n=1 Tax=Camellia lanceoleosa TaxID=1840588 RepID=A0ACC0FR36_9ERIC|nr:Protein OPAQUE1 [Camellia lanceoleosa]
MDANFYDLTTELVTRSIKVMMESGCEERCFVNTSLEEKLWNLEDENHVLRQKALSSPKGSCPGFVKPFLEKYSAALALPYADQKPVSESPTPTKLIAPLAQGLSDSRRTKLTTERQQTWYYLKVMGIDKLRS